MMSTPPAIDLALASPDPEVRRRATSRLTELEPERAIELVVRALGDEDWRVRKEAAQIAVLLGPSPILLDQLVALFHPGENVGQRNAAVEALAAFGASAVRVIGEALPMLDADGRKLAADVLGRAQDPSAMPALEQLVNDSDPNVCVGAVEAIGELGPVAVDAASRILVRVLLDGDLWSRFAALEGLNRLGVVVPWEQLAPLLRDPMLRRPALIAASRSGRREAAEALARALEDENPSVARSAFIGLADLVLGGGAPIRGWQTDALSLGPHGRVRLLEALAPGMQDVDARRAALVVAALFQEPAGIDVAIDGLIDDRLAHEADAALAVFGTRALPRLLARVVHGDAPLRAAAIGKLAALYDDANDDDIRFALHAAIGDRSPDVAGAALRALSELGRAEDLAPVFALLGDRTRGGFAAARAALGALARRFPDEARATAQRAPRDEASRLGVATIIGALQGNVLGRVADDVAFLASALSSPEPDTRRIAVVALGEVRSELAMDALQFALADEERDIRVAAVRAFGRLQTDSGAPAGADRLLELLRESSDTELVAAAARALGDTGDARALEPLGELAHSTNPMVAVAAIESLARMRHRSSIEALLEAANHPHAEVVKTALLALEGVPDRRVLYTLASTLSHAEWDVRRLAADSLGRQGSDDAADLLRDRLAHEQEPLVREAINRAITVIEAPSTARRMGTIAPPKVES